MKIDKGYLSGVFSGFNDIGQYPEEPISMRATLLMVKYSELGQDIEWIDSDGRACKVFDMTCNRVFDLISYLIDKFEADPNTCRVGDLSYYRVWLDIFRDSLDSRTPLTGEAFNEYYRKYLINGRMNDENK